MTPEDIKDFYLNDLRFTEVGFWEHLECAISEYRDSDVKRKSKYADQFMNIFVKQCSGFTLTDLTDIVQLPTGSLRSIGKITWGALFKYTLASDFIPIDQKDELRRFIYDSL